MKWPQAHKGTKIHEEFFVHLQLLIAKEFKPIKQQRESLPFQCTRFSKPRQYCSRNSFLRIFPVPPLGSASRNSIDLGTLKPGNPVRQKAISASSVIFSPGFKTTSAFGASP